MDLEVDICLFNDGRVVVLDEDKLKNSYVAGIISQRLFDKAKFEVDHVLNAVVPNFLMEDLS